MTRSPRVIGNLKKISEILVLLLGDSLSILMVIKLSVYLRLNMLPVLAPRFARDAYVSEINTYLIFAVWMFFLLYEGLYTRRFSFWDEVLSSVKACAYGAVGVFFIGSLGKMSTEISRSIVLFSGMISIAVIPSVRLVLKSLLRRAGLLNRRVLMLGAGKTGRMIAQALRDESNLGYEIVGFLDDDDAKVGTMVDGIKVHRGVDRASRYVRRSGITDIFVAMPGVGSERMRGLVNSLQHRVDRLFVVPDMFGMAVTGTRLTHFFKAQAFAFEMQNNLAYPINNLIKRAFDLAVCLVFIPLLLIPMGVIALYIRLGSRGSAIFRQERIGRHRRSFMCMKFRTMYEDADARLHAILRDDPEASKEWAAYWKLREDPRVTPAGKFLRRTSLDELPQMFNVLLGQMSLVGPRPYIYREWEALEEYSDIVLGVRPGITGLWQVSGRSDTTFDVRLSLDAWYVRNWNLSLDLVVLLKTVAVVLRRTGAR